jgi:sugar phosphate isomerase/epimerase
MAFERMKLGLFAKIFARPTVEEVFAAVARRSVRFVQFNFASAGLPSLPEAIEPAVLEEIRRAAVRHRIGLAAVSGTFNMSHPDRTQRRTGLQRLEVIAGACATLQTQVITLCTGTRDPEDMWRRHPDNDSEEAWRDLCVSMTKALTTADKHGVTLGIEPETGNVVNSARQARRLLDEMRSPRLKIVIDAANLFQPGDLRRMTEILDEAFDLLGSDLVLAHAKELGAEGHAGNLALGAGVLDWAHYLELLRAARFPGPLILHGFEEKDLIPSLKFLRGLLSPQRTG